MSDAQEAIITQRYTPAIVLLGLAGHLFASDPFEGIWRLDPAKSSGTFPKGETVTIRKRDRRLAVDMQIVNGNSTSSRFSISYTVPLDGGVGHVEKGPIDGVILRRLSTNEMEITYLSSGKEVRSTRAIISKDGATMTSTGKAPSPGENVTWTMIFEKQGNSKARDK